MRELMKTYRDLAEAEQARQSLLSAGLPGDSVQLQAQGDEAGAVAGNFINGDYDADDKDWSYDEKFRHVDLGGVYILTVRTEDAALGERAAGILGTGHESS